MRSEVLTQVLEPFGSSWTAQIFMIQELAPLNVGNHLTMDMASCQRNPQTSEYAIAKRPVMKVLFSVLLLLLLVAVVVVEVLTHLLRDHRKTNVSLT